MGDCYREGMYCGPESPSPSRPDSASGRGHPCKVTFMLQICSCHAPVSGPSVASCSFRPKTNILAHLQGRGAWSQPTSAALSHTFVFCCLPSKDPGCLSGPCLLLQGHGYGFLCLEGSSSTHFMELATTNTLDLNPNVSSSGNSSLSPWSRSH